MQRIDDLQINGLKVIQDDEYFCFGSDSVELANFVSASPRDIVVDLGAGNGVISILLAGKKAARVVAVEICPHLSKLCQQNIMLNGLEKLMDVINSPMQELKLLLTHPWLKKSGANVVVSNPPYYKMNSGLLNSADSIAPSRHEINVTQKELAACASGLLSTGGRFYVCYPIDRLAETIYNCKAVSLEPKQLCLLNWDKNPPHLFMLKCIKGAAEGINVLVREMINRM